MAIVTVNQGESIESALRRFKRKVMTEEIIKDAKKHAFYSARTEGETEVSPGAQTKQEEGPDAHPRRLSTSPATTADLTSRSKTGRTLILNPCLLKHG